MLHVIDPRKNCIAIRAPPTAHPSMRLTLLLLSVVLAGPLRLHPGLRVSRSFVTPAVRMSDEECVIPGARDQRFAKLDAALKQLQADGIEEEVLAPLKRELAEFKLENVKLELAELKTELSQAAAALPPPPPLQLPPPPPAQPRAETRVAPGFEQRRNPAYEPPTDNPYQSNGLLEAVLTTVFGPPRRLTAAERAARADAKKRRVAAARADMERDAERRLEAAKLAAMRTEAKRAAYEKAVAERQAAERAREKQDARQDARQVLQEALAAVEFGQRAGSPAERRQLRAAIVRAQAAGVVADEVVRAEGLEQLTLAKAEAAAAAERAAAEKAARERAEAEARAVQMNQAREVLRRSVARPVEERKKILRDLQVKWHPDKFAGGGDEQTRTFAAELSRMANEAADIARKQAAAAAAKEKQMAAYNNLRGMTNPSVEELRTAIRTARDAGVSDIEISRAESKLRGLKL